MKTGDFNTSFIHYELDDLKSRQRILVVAAILGFLYLSLTILVGFVFSDILIFLGTLFIVYRAKVVGHEIGQIEQYIHGEEVPALS
jgi:small-conductance mechanosensitive channel